MNSTIIKFLGNVYLVFFANLSIYFNIIAVLNKNFSIDSCANLLYIYISAIIVLIGIFDAKRHFELMVGKDL